MLRFLPITAYLLALCAIIVWRFGAGLMPHEIADRARLAACDFIPTVQVSLAGLSMQMEAGSNVSIIAADGTTYAPEIAPEARGLPQFQGFCPNPPQAGVVAREVAIISWSVDDVLGDHDIPLSAFQWLLLEADAAPAPPPAPDWRQLVPAGEDGLQTSGLSPGGLLIGALCDDAECELWASDPSLGLRATLKSVEHEGAMVAGAVMPDDLLAYAATMFAGVRALGN